MTDSPSTGYTLMPALTVTGSCPGRIEVEHLRGEERLQSRDGRLECPCPRRVDDQQELIGSVAADDGARVELADEQPGGLPQCRVPGFVAIGVVQQPESIDVDQGDPDRLRYLTGRFDPGGERCEQRPVIGKSGQRVASRARRRVASSVG